MSEVVKPIFKLDLEPGDILHVTVGGEFHDGQPPWIPSQEELEEARLVWAAAVPDNVRVIVTHYLVKTQVIRTH